MALLLWILAVILVVSGIVSLIRGQMLWGIVLIIVGLLVGPVGSASSRAPSGMRSGAPAGGPGVHPRSSRPALRLHGPGPRLLRRQDRLPAGELHPAAVARGGLRPAGPRAPGPGVSAIRKGVGHFPREPEVARLKVPTEGSMTWLCCCGSSPSSSWCPASSR